MAQVQKQKTTTEKKAEEQKAQANPKTVENKKKTIENAKSLEDKIDDILEENAEEFVKNYVQKGGE